MSYKLLTVSGNPKVMKGDKVSKYLTAIMHLSPINTKICPYQDIAGCKEACLNTAGRGGIFKKGETTNIIQEARKRRTNLFLNDREEFMKLLIKEISKFQNYCNNKGVKPAIRLNGTSDIQWEKIPLPKFYQQYNNFLERKPRHIFDMFYSIQFYDYTKIPTRKVSDIENYHLTWSYSQANKKYADYFKKVEHNKAAVFNTKILPSFFKGLKVINGDTHDMRFLDEDNVVVGLRAKGKAKTDTSGFVIPTHQIY